MATTLARKMTTVSCILYERATLLAQQEREFIRQFTLLSTSAYVYLTNSKAQRRQSPEVAAQRVPLSYFSSVSSFSKFIIFFIFNIFLLRKCFNHIHKMNTPLFIELCAVYRIVNLWCSKNVERPALIKLQTDHRAIQNPETRRGDNRTHNACRRQAPSQTEARVLFIGRWHPYFPDLLVGAGYPILKGEDG